MPPRQDSSSALENEMQLYNNHSKPVMMVSKTSKKVNISLSNNVVFKIPHLDDLSDEEVKATWYEREDYENIKKALIPIIRKMMKNEHIEETDRMTIRGLEYRTRKGALRRQHNKVEAISAVLDEQDRQLDTTNTTDDELIRSVYQECNSHCQLEANELANTDVEPARKHCANATIKHIHKLHDREMGEDGVGVPERKPSLGKLFKQMRIRRRSSHDNLMEGASPAANSDTLTNRQELVQNAA